MCEEDGTHQRISFWYLLMNFEKPQKSDFWKNEKNCWRYHHFTHAYQKPQSYEVQFLRYGVRQNYLSFCVILYPFTPLPPLTQKTEILTKWKKASGDVIILNLSKKNMIIWCMLTQIWSATHNFLSFQVIFCSFVPLLIPKIKIWKKM